MTTPRLFHYTDDEGYKAIVAQPTWIFKADQPPGDHPIGVYFTTLGPATRNLAKRLRIPKQKIKYVFCFEDRGDLKRLDGARGQFILYSPGDYAVAPDRQQFHGSLEQAAEQFP